MCVCIYINSCKYIYIYIYYIGLSIYRKFYAVQSSGFLLVQLGKVPGVIMPLVRRRAWVYSRWPSNLFHFLVLQIKKEMSEYWLLSVPGDNTEGQPSWDDLKKKIGSLSNVSKFHIPDLKVGENIARFVMGSSLGHETRDYS